MKLSQIISHVRVSVLSVPEILIKHCTLYNKEIHDTYLMLLTILRHSPVTDIDKIRKYNCSIFNLKFVLMLEFRNGITNVALHVMICPDGEEDEKIEVHPQ